MNADKSGKAVAAASGDDRSLPALLQRLRKLRARVPGELSVEDVERELQRIETAKLVKGAKVQARKNLRERLIYALADAGGVDEHAADGAGSSSAALPCGDASGEPATAALDAALPAAQPPLPQLAEPPSPSSDLMDVQRMLSALSLRAHEGAWVRVIGLKARADLNGVVARLGAWDAETSRRHVPHTLGARCSCVG